MYKFSAIITPTWNNEDYTIRCFDSIGKNTKDYKIIWIDNGSTKESRNRVKKFLDENDILYELIQNEENLGFVKATNQGIKRAMELGVEYVVLQNNDTEVYEGWLERYKEVAESDPKIGIVGPITSPCTSWQSIENLKNSIPEFSNLPEYNNNPEEYSKIIKKKYDGEIFESKIQVAFFSTLIKKEVIEDIGFLSEEFGVGFGDDDDYCIRAMKKKWKLFLARDVFVFHNHRTTFKKIYSDKTISQMLDKNGEAYRRKHKDFLDKDVKKNDICFFSHSAHLGGSERSLLELVKDLKSKEILCHVFLPENGPLEDELKKIAVSYEVVDYRWWTLQENEDKRDVVKGINEQSMSLIERVAKLNPNLIYTNTSVVNVGAIIAKELGIPHVWHVREYGEKDHGLKFVLDEKERARYISNNSDFVFFNSDAVRDYYSKLADFKSNAVVYNSVSVDNFNQDLERGEVFKKDNLFHVSIIGTVSPGKGQKDAVMAMKKLINKGQKIELAIIGNVSDIAYLSEIEEIIKKEGLEDNIHIYNFIRNVFPIIKKSDLILVCSKNEAFGRVTVEGMLAKKTVIGTNSGGTPEIIEDGVSGFLYEPGDYDQLAEKIEWLIKNPKEAKKMGENGYKIVSDKFSKNNYSGKIVRILREVINDNLIRDIFREEGANLVLSLLKEIKSKDQEMDIKNGENACLKEENEKIKEENEKIREEVLIIKNSKFWKMRNFYLKIKHYFIFIFLNPRKFLKKFLKLFPLLCIEVLNSMKKENPNKTATRIFNYVIYGKGVLNKDEIGKRRIGFIPSPKSMREIESLEIKNIESIHFQKFEEVRVSIVIPVYNKWQYTYICLSSLKKNINRRIPYEVILIDDGSTDETQNLSENIVSNIVYVKNDKNLGFVGSCNVGAKKARGKFIVFLNNDTFIKKYWLESLIDTFENNENVGLVGSKLICADGVLQEAGGIVWKNKNCWNYGRFGNPTDPAFNYLKDVDYCSGASIMLSREIFDKLSGFDEVYAPGYFEDTDLAFRVRQLGLRTVYQPKSELYHFENISAGKDETSGMRQYIVLNRETFFDRWKGVLSEENCDENIEGSFLARDRSKNKKTVLVIDHYVPTFDQDAGSRSTFQYIKLLCQMGYNVKFFGDNCVKTEPYTSALQQMGVEVLYGEWFLDNFNSWLNDNGKYIDFVFVNRPHIFEKHIDNIKKYTNAKVVFYGHDLHFLRLKREYDVTNDEKFLEESNIWKEKELDIIKKADVSLYPSVVEVDILNKIDVLKDRCIDVLNLNIYNDTSFGYKAEDRRDILFIGGFSHRPNVDAILWFCRDIFPNFIKKYPDLVLYIVGSNPPKEVNDLSSKNIIVKGFVSDEELSVLYGKIRLVVVPLRYGAGIKGKIIESLYHGVPVLTTNCGAEGIDNNVLMIADDAENFSQSLVNNYENYRFLNDLSKNGKIFVNKQYSINLAKEKIIKYFV